MKIRLIPLLIAAFLSAWSATAFAVENEPEAQRVGAAFVLALGRTPSAEETAAWMQEAPRSVSALVTRHRQQLQRDAALQRTTLAKAWADAFGLPFADANRDAMPSTALTYTEQVQQHIRRLTENHDEYLQVIDRAYQRALRRPAYDLELDYWKARDVLPFALMVGCIENWAVRNAPGLMATTGIASISVNSAYLSTLRLSPGVATEARAAVGLGSPASADVVSATGRTLVAAGASQILSIGRIHFVATGGPALPH